MCREHTPFYSAGAYDDKRTNLIIGDAKAGLEALADGSLDVIICDLSDPLDGGPCYQLYTTSFYAMCKEKLAPGGILVTQSGCASVRDCHLVFTPIHNTLKQVFPRVWGYTTCGTCCVSQIPLPRLSIVQGNYSYTSQKTDTFFYRYQSRPSPRSGALTSAPRTKTRPICTSGSWRTEPWRKG